MSCRDDQVVLGNYFAVLTVLFLSGCFGSLAGAGSGPVKTSIGSCSPEPCVVVDISSLPEIPDSVSKDAKRIIETELRQVLYAPLDVDTTNPSQEVLLKELEARLREYDQVSDVELNWSLTRSARVLYSDLKVASFEVTNKGYLGGAHGFNDRTLMTYDSKTGHRLGVADVVSDSSQKVLNRVVEAEFRRIRSIRADQSLQDAGFFILPGQELPLGENFALTSDGLEIQYNPYEVAPYALGETRVNVPRAAIAPLVKAELQGVFSSSATQALSR